MPFLFLREEFDALCEQCGREREKYHMAAKASGEACGQGAETFHDNFPYEQAMREMQMHGKIVSELEAIIKDAEIVSAPTSPTTVQIGTKVKVFDTDSYEDFSVYIGSYRLPITVILEEVSALGEKTISVSYASPIGKCLLGSQVGETRTLTLEKEQKKLFVVEIKV